MTRELLAVTSGTGTLAPLLPEALLARLARPIEVLTETVECTMVFADVSGFTRLSERLARQGKEGAEQLVDIINACFSALLAEAYGRGGSLVKFGGDAMLLVFYDQEGNQEHGARACSAAAAMRRTLREIGRIRAGDTNVVLRMSVGVHSGPYAMFVVGGSHRELLIGGPGGEHGRGDGGGRRFWPDLDQPGDRPAAAPQLRGRSGRPRLAARPVTGAALSGCRRRGCRLRREEVIAGFLPAAIRAHLLGGSAVPEHRTATIAFLQFGGLDQVLAGDGPDQAARRLDELVRLVQEACRALRGVLPGLGYRLGRRQDPVERRRPAGGG